MTQSVIQDAPRTAFKLCADHERELDGIAREFPPAIETSFKASQYLMAMAEAEAEPSMEILRCPACAIGNGDAADAGYSLVRAIKCTLSPDQVPLDLVVRRLGPDEQPEPGTARIEWPDPAPENKNEDPLIKFWDAKCDSQKVKITLYISDHRENPLPPLPFEAFLGGMPRTGKYLRFVLREIANGVYKLAPSVRVPGLIVCFVTIVE
jgi:hypothetical protein